MTFRAIEVLKDCDYILAEDTRKTSFLLNHFSIDKKIKSYHKFNEHKTVSSLIDELLSGKKIALVTDAGTPGISDPGFLIARECIAHEIEIECLPGATALIPALINSGFPSDRFTFEGFLPQKKGRMKRLSELKSEERTMIFYESPYRLVKTLEQFTETFGPDRLCSVSREISKIHEETFRGSLTAVSEHFRTKPVKGEIVIILHGL